MTRLKQRLTLVGCMVVVTPREFFCSRGCTSVADYPAAYCYRRLLKVGQGAEGRQGRSWAGQEQGRAWAGAGKGQELGRGRRWAGGVCRCSPRPGSY